MYDGVLEKDPMDDSYRLRVLDEKGDLVGTLCLHDILRDYVGKEVRLTVAAVAGLEAYAQSANEKANLAAVTFDDVAKGR